MELFTRCVHSTSLLARPISVAFCAFRLVARNGASQVKILVIVSFILLVMKNGLYTVEIMFGLYTFLYNGFVSAVIYRIILFGLANH